MAEHRPLGKPGGARGIQDRSQIVGGDLDDLLAGRRRRSGLGQLTLPGGTQTQHSRYACRSHDRRQGLFSVGRTHEQAWRRILQEITQLLGRVGGIQGYVDRPGTQTAQIQQHGLDRLFDLDHHPVALLHAALLQQAEHLSGTKWHLSVEQAATVDAIEKQRRRIFRKAFEEQGIEIRVVHSYRFLQSSLRFIQPSALTG